MTYLVLRYAHIIGGVLTLAFGVIAMFVVKGSRLHRAAGTMFCGSMLVLATTGLVIALGGDRNMGNIMGGLTALYMVLTAWATVRRPPGVIGRFEVVAAAMAFLMGGAAAAGGLVAANAPNGRLYGYPPVFYAVFASVLLLAGALDVRMIVRRGVAGVARTTRHLSRVSLAFFMATGSFFFGQRQFVPQVMLDTGTYVAAAFFPLVMMAFWLARVRLWPALRRGTPNAPKAGVPN